MASKTVVELIDDLDGESAAEETVRFALDGTNYEIDLSDYHAKALRENLADYVNAGRKVTGQSKAKATAAPRRNGDANELRAIREWAGSQGFTVAARGRVPAKVIEAYRSEH